MRHQKEYEYINIIFLLIHHVSIFLLICHVNMRINIYYAYHYIFNCIHEVRVYMHIYVHKFNCIYLHVHVLSKECKHANP